MIEEGIVELYETEFKYPDLIDKKHLRFDFFVWLVNGKYFILEFDGCHDNPIYGDVKGFNTQQQHDKMKNEYCKNNSIPLLRIHYKDFKNIERIIVDYIKGL